MTDRRLSALSKALAPPPGVRLWYGGAGIPGCLRGVNAEQAAWKPGPDRPGIWELTLHIAYWKYAVRRKLTGGPTGAFPHAADWPPIPDPASESNWKKDRRLLRDQHRALADVVQTLSSRSLDRPPDVETKWTRDDLVMGVIMHDMYHVGQIQYVKRLYRDRRDGVGS